MTLEQIRAALPTHIMLTPGRNHYREGDGVLFNFPNHWREIDYEELKRPNATLVSRLTRRPIPPHILDNQALWLWLDTVEGTEQTPPLEEIHKANLLAAWQNIAQAGRLYDKWLLEQMEDV
jgi:hypothetical protein